MKLKFRNTLASVGLMLWLLTACPFQICFQLKARAQQNTPQPVSLKVNTKNIGGAFELTAETLLYGDVKVYLPDDMAGGDTISGTVVAEPKGNTAAERAKNESVLSGYVVEIGEQKVSTSRGAFKWVVPDVPVKLIRIIEVVSGKELAKMQVPMKPVLKNTLPQPVNFQLPTIGQQGRALEIPGPFDGDFSNTTLNWKSASQDFEKNTENVSGGFGLLAESPRKAIFRSPRNVTGTLEINLKEGSTEATGTFRNVGVRLSAPKTNLVKGESTTVTVMVVGLEGIKQSIPLQLETSGVVTMDGGNSQYIQLSPTLVSGNGTLTLSRTLTGQQAGGFAVMASIFVKPLDACLLDEKEGSTFFFNSTTGDYIFMQPGGISGGGQGTVTKKGCVLTLTDNRLDRRVMSKLDPCTKTGSATVETSAPKVKFTITDRNTADNTCAAR